FTKVALFEPPSRRKPPIDDRCADDPYDLLADRRCRPGDSKTVLHRQKVLEADDVGLSDLGRNSAAAIASATDACNRRRGIIADPSSRARPHSAATPKAGRCRAAARARSSAPSTPSSRWTRPR